jgi:23S rRNA (pseudouridine1915-N3)-methyltransferase
MRMVVAVVGKPRDRDLASAIRNYETRAARYWPLAVHTVREESSKSGTPQHVMKLEGERLLAALAPVRKVIACDPGGDQFTSEEFAALLQRFREEAVDVGFVIGGAFGLSEEVLGRSTLRISMAPWTLPHEVARLVLAEQLYRAGTVVRGEPYHK